MTARNCFSKGDINGGNTGGIFGFGYNVSSTVAVNCYTSGELIGTGSGGIFSGNTTNSGNNYSEGNNGTPGWNTTNAKLYLTGVPSPIVGTVWCEVATNTPFILYNIGLSPYTNQDVKEYSISLEPGQSSSPPVSSVWTNYQILSINGQSPSLFPGISIQQTGSNRGVITVSPSLSNGTYNLVIYSFVNPYSISELSLLVSGYIICYNENTTVLAHTINGEKEYIKIQDLRPNDFVETYKHGLLPIKQIGKRTLRNGKTPLTSMYRIPKNGNMTDDLIVSGSHNILMDRKPKRKSIYHKKRTIDGKYRILASDIPQAQQLKDNNEYTLYHIVIEGQNPRYGIFVNGGLIAETTTESDYKKFGFKSL